MKYKKSLLIISVVAALCSACAKNGGIDNANNIDYETSYSLASTEEQSNENTRADVGNVTNGERADAWISLIEPEERNYYYAAEHELEIGEDEHIYDGEWCLAANGIYYVTKVYYDDYVESKLRFINYDDIVALENTDNMILGSLERGDKLSGLSEEITLNLEGYGEVDSSYVSAYNDGAAVVTYGSDGENIIDLIVYLDGNNDVVKIVDVTEQEETVQELMQEEIEWAVTTENQIFARENGNLICSSYEERKKSILCFYTEDSQEVKKIVADYSIGNVIYDGIDSLYWIHRGGEDGQKLVRCDINTGETQEGSFDGMKESAYIYVGADKSVLWSQKGIYQLDISAGTLTRVMNWNEAGVKNGIYDRVCIMGDGSIYGAKLVSGAISLCRLQKSGVAINDEKTVLKLAVPENCSTKIDQLVRDFNASNSMYSVEISRFDNNYSYVTALTSKNGPDLISANMIDLAQAAKNSYTVDLNEFLQSEESTVKADDLLESVRNVYAYNGRLVALPAIFRPVVIYGGDEFSSMSDWDIDAFVELVERNDRAVTNFMASAIDCSYDLLGVYWDSMKDKLVDWENGEAHFDTDEFIRFLNAYKNYNPPMDVNGNDSEATYWSKGQIYLYKGVVYFPSLIQYIRAVMGTDNPVLLGYPTGNGTVGMSDNGTSFAISANSSNKEGAWLFMQYILKNGDEFMDVTGNVAMSYPVYLPRLEEVLDTAAKKEYKRDENYDIVLDMDGNPVESAVTTWGNGDVKVNIYSMSERDREELWRIFDNIGLIYAGASAAEDIFYEEVEAFKDGLQTAEQTAKILQDRVTLMLEE